MKTSLPYKPPCTACGQLGDAHTPQGKCLFGPGGYTPMTKETFSIPLYQYAHRALSDRYYMDNDVEAFECDVAHLGSLCPHPPPPRDTLLIRSICYYCERYI